MCDKPVLHYVNGRGKMESIRWALAAVGVEFEEKLFETKEEREQLIKTGDLLFQQVPMVEIDGMKLVQTRAILNYIAAKYNIYGRDIRERAYIDMYVEGTSDLMEFIMALHFLPEGEQENRKQLIKESALKRYYPVYEKALENQKHLVGNQFSLADVHLFEAILMVEELHGDLLQDFPNLKLFSFWPSEDYSKYYHLLCKRHRLLAFKARIGEMPTIKKFLEPGSKRKPPANAKYAANVNKIFDL
ncbi:glutathione S-transferase-like [Gastrophryne carolinensis]